MVEKSQSSEGLAIAQTIELAKLQAGDFTSIGIEKEITALGPPTGLDENTIISKLLSDLNQTPDDSLTEQDIPADDQGVTLGDIEDMKSSGLGDFVKKKAEKMKDDEGVKNADPNKTFSDKDEKDDESAFSQGNPFFNQPDFD